MGWGTGCYVAEDLWAALRVFIPEQHHPQAAQAIIKVLEGYDWDTHCDAPKIMESAFGPEWYRRGEDSEEA